MPKEDDVEKVYDCVIACSSRKGRLQCDQEESTEEHEMKQQQRMAIMKDLIKKIRSKRKHGCQEPLVGLGVACEGL